MFVRARPRGRCEVQARPTSAVDNVCRFAIEEADGRRVSVESDHDGIALEAEPRRRVKKSLYWRRTWGAEAAEAIERSRQAWTQMEGACCRGLKRPTTEGSSERPSEASSDNVR